jgi:hypothetical protein
MLTIALFATALAANSAASSPTSGEMKLARALEGHTAGKPVSCIPLRQIRSSHIIDDTAIVFETGNGTLYVHRPDLGEVGLSGTNTLVLKTHSSQLCRGDTLILYDGASKHEVGSVALGSLVPHRRDSKPYLLENAQSGGGY